MPTSYTGTTLNYHGIDLDQREAQKILDTLAIVPGAAVRATIRAANKTLTRVRRQVLRHLSVRNQVPQKAFKGRVFLRRANRRQAEITAGLWIGTRPLAASRIGTLKKTRKGYRAGKHYFPGAFEATMPSGHEGVFMRAPAGYKARRSKGWTEGRPHTSSRNLPIVEPFIEIDLGGEVILQDLQADYLRTLGQEANFELQKSLGRIKR